MKLWKIVLYYIILLACISFTAICLIFEKFEFAIAIFGITIPYATIFMNQDFELKKIKIATVCKNNMEVYMQLSQIINKLLDVLSCLEHNKFGYDFYEDSRRLKKEQTKKGGRFHEVPPEKETNKELYINTKKWLDEFHKLVDSLYVMYDDKGIYFSNCVDKQYRKIVDKKWITQITARWHNCNLSGDCKEALSCFFAGYNFKDVLCLKKELQKFLKIIKKDLGV